MKRILLATSLLASAQLFAVGNFCASPSMSYQSGCTSTCSAIAASGKFSLERNTSGVCMGKATVKTLEIRKIELGKTEIGNESRCSIWEGDDIVLNEVSGLGLSSKSPISLKNCNVGTTYDAIYFTLGRYELNAGEALFPDDSGKIARSTNIFAGKDSTRNDYSNLSSWRDVASADSTLAYTIPNAGSPAWIHKKISSTPSSADLQASSNATMIWDRLKSMHSTYTNTAARPGYTCFSNPDGSGLDTNDCVVDNGNDTYTTITPSEYVAGLPLTLKKGDETLDIEYNVLKVNRGNNQYHGTQFLWHMSSDDKLEYVGIQPAEIEGDYSQIVISNVRPGDGL